MQMPELTRMDLSQHGGGQRPTPEKQGRQKGALIRASPGLQQESEAVSQGAGRAPLAPAVVRLCSPYYNSSWKYGAHQLFSFKQAY